MSASRVYPNGTSIKRPNRVGFERLARSIPEANPIGNNLLDNVDNVVAQWQAGKITAIKAMRISGLSKSTFYRLVKASH